MSLSNRLAEYRPVDIVAAIVESSNGPGNGLGNIASLSPQRPFTRVHIRWMIRRDMPETMAIEHAAFDHPWTEGEILTNLRDRSCIGMVAEHGGKVVGYMIYFLRKKHLEVKKLVIHPDYRRSGIGHQMVGKLVGKLSNHRRPSLALLVRESNVDGLLFLRSQGFKAVRLARGAYDDTGEDGVDMRYLLQEQCEDGNTEIDGERHRSMNPNHSERDA